MTPHSPSLRERGRGRKMSKSRKVAPTVTATATVTDAYHLASMVLDCRIDRWIDGDKTVACMVPKSIRVAQ